MLDRLAHTWATKSFDTRGPHDDLLRLLAGTAKALIDVTQRHEQQQLNVEAKLDQISKLLPNIEQLQQEARHVVESAKRIDFLWASQGLATLELSEAHCPADAVDAACTPTANERLDLAVRTLQQSQANQQLLHRGAAAVTEATSASALVLRLDAVQDVIDGVFGVTKKLEAQVTKLCGDCERAERFALALEKRVTVNAEMLDHVSLRATESAATLQKSVDDVRRHQRGVDGELATVQSAVSGARAAAEEAATKVLQVKDQIPSAATVRAMINREVAKTHQPHPATLALYGLLDVDVSAAQQAKSTSDAVRLMHRSAPFRPLLAGLQRLRDEVADLAQKAAPIPRPKLGLELRDHDGGCLVERCCDGSVAAAADVRQGDVVVAVDGHAIFNRQDFQAAMSAARVNRSPDVTLELARGAARHRVRLPC